MNILSFQKFKLLLEAEGDAPAEPAAEPAAPEETPAQTDTPEPPASPAPADSGSAAPAPTDPLSSLALPADPNAPAAPTEGTASLKLVFLNDEHPWHSQYSDGGGVKRFKEYEITQPDLEKWITENGLDSNKDDIIQAVNGKKSIEPSVFDKLKSALAAGKFGKDRGDVDVEFDQRNSPSTNKLDLIFIKSA